MLSGILDGPDSICFRIHFKVYPVPLSSARTNRIFKENVHTHRDLLLKRTPHLLLPCCLFFNSCPSLKRNIQQESEVNVLIDLILLFDHIGQILAYFCVKRSTENNFQSLSYKERLMFFCRCFFFSKLSYAHIVPLLLYDNVSNWLDTLIVSFNIKRIIKAKHGLYFLVKKELAKKNQISNYLPKCRNLDLVAPRMCVLNNTFPAKKIFQHILVGHRIHIREEIGSRWPQTTYLES